MGSVVTAPTQAQIAHAREHVERLNFAAGWHVARVLPNTDTIVIGTVAARHLEERLRELYERRGECLALIHHGPGHQSSSRCELKGDHDVHQVAMRGREVMRWRGDEESTGFFDESPEEDE